MNKPKILCFGELLYRIQSAGEIFNSPDATSAELFPGGAEANVAVALGQMNVDVAYLSSAPANVLVTNILKSMSTFGVDTSGVRLEGERLGSYILLGANGLTSGEVIYDRKYSTFAQLKRNSIDWNSVFDGIDWFHWTALTPGLSEEHAALCFEALKEAKSRKIFISVDLNFRNRLWQYGKEPIEIMPRLVEYCDFIMGNIWASNKMLGTVLEEEWSGNRSSVDYPVVSGLVAQDVFDKYPNCKHLAFTFRFMDNPKHNLFYATYHTKTSNYISDILETNQVIDRIGSGDAFMAGLIAGLVKGYDGQKLISFATDIGFKKLFVKGDFIKL